MIKMVALMKRKPGLSLEQFIERYEQYHAPFAKPHMPHAVRYERRFLRPLGNPLTGGDGESVFDVLTEVWFPDRAALEADLGHIATPEMMAAFAADEEPLFDRAHHRLFLIEDERQTEL